MYLLNAFIENRKPTIKLRIFGHSPLNHLRGHLDCYYRTQRNLAIRYLIHKNISTLKINAECAITSTSIQDMPPADGATVRSSIRIEISCFLYQSRSGAHSYCGESLKDDRRGFKNLAYHSIGIIDKDWEALFADEEICP